jgi:hypothetical protein
MSAAGHSAVRARLRPANCHKTVTMVILTISPERSGPWSGDLGDALPNTASQVIRRPSEVTIGVGAVEFF